MNSRWIMTTGIFSRLWNNEGQPTVADPDQPFAPTGQGESLHNFGYRPFAPTVQGDIIINAIATDPLHLRCKGTSSPMLLLPTLWTYGARGHHHQYYCYRPFAPNGARRNKITILKCMLHRCKGLIVR